VTRLKTQNTFGITKHIRNHKTHLEITKHIWKSQNTFRNHETHLEITKHSWNQLITKHIWNQKTHLESQNTFRNLKTHL
jgi:hypothetical protein